MFFEKFFSFLALGAVSAVATACGVPAMDGTSALGKQAVLDQVNQDLSIQDCKDALALVLPVYNSSNTDNDIRMATAESYACSANFNLLDTVSSLTNGVSLTGGAFFDFLATTFPSNPNNPNDRVVEGADLAMDALMASLNTGAVILPTTYFNTGTYNPASLNYTDRTGDSNIYLIFMTMVAIGGLENRYGAPNSSGVGTTKLPWDSLSTGATPPTTPTQSQLDGCAFGSALVNFADALDGGGAALGGAIAKAIGTLQKDFVDAINAGCAAGCESCNPVTPLCTACPLTLRNRSSCIYTNTDPNSCAVAGLSALVNTDWEGSP